VQRLGGGQAAVPGAFVQRRVNGLARRREHQHLLACAMRGGAQRFKRVRLARTGGGLQRLHQEGRDRNAGDGALLIGRQVAKVFGAHIQAAAVVGLINDVQYPLLLEHDEVQGVFLVSFAVLCGAGKCDPICRRSR
jgi:hypothetical protein